WKWLQRVCRQTGRVAAEARARAEAVRIREVGGCRETDGTVLIGLRDKIASESIVDHPCSCADRARFSEQFLDKPLVSLRAIRQSESGREVHVAGFPPCRFSVRGAVQIPVENRVGHRILWHA